MVSKITPENIITSASSYTSLREKKIPFMGGRPERGEAISHDDILNLIISFNICNSLEEFLSQT